MALTVDEPMRYLPVLIALAEQMWMTGVPDPRITELAVPRLGELAAIRGHALADRQPGGLAASAGSRRHAAHRAARALPRPSGTAGTPRPPRGGVGPGARSPRRWPWPTRRAPDDGVQAVSLLDRLGAVGTADRLRRELRRSGVASVPKRPSETTRTNPGGLTNRQLEVARLLARGFTNSEIATQVFISPKTAEHHVAAVLTKLGLPSRRESVLHAAELGLD